MQEGLSDIDSLIAKMPHYQKVRFNAELKIAVERAKVELSNATVARIDPATPLLDELGIAIPVEVELTREQFEAMILWWNVPSRFAMKHCTTLNIPQKWWM